MFAAVDDCGVGAVNGAMAAEVKFLMDFVDQALSGVEFFVQVAVFGEEGAKMGVEPFGVLGLVFGAETFEFGFGFFEVALDFFVFAAGFFADGSAVDDEEAPGAGGGRAF